MDAVPPPLNLIEVVEPSAFRTGKRVPYGDLLARLRKRWYVDTSLGRVFFKRLSQLDRDRIYVEYANAHPEFADMVQDAEILKEFVSKGVPLDKPHLEKLATLNRMLIPVQKLQAATCILDIDERGNEKPAFGSMEEYDAFLSALQPPEVDMIYSLLNEMVSTTPITEESHVMLALAKEYNIPLAKDLTLENMTAEIADALVENAEAQSEAMRKELSKLKG
jgi:hypothetical protein